MRCLYLNWVFILSIALQITSINAFSAKHKLKTLVENSSLILSGKVETINSKIENEGKHDVVYTYVTLKIKSIEKGIINKKYVTIKMLGGKVGNQGGWSEHWFHFKKGEEAIVFLTQIDKKNNIWEIKSISGKLPFVDVKGDKKLDCSMLREDDLLKVNSDPYFEKDMIKELIKKYISGKKGGK